jgi:hypothetical protein
MTFNSIKAQNSSAVELFTEEDLKFLQEKGIDPSEFTDKQIREIKQPPPGAHEERIKTCMEMKDTNFIASDIECVSWTLSAEASYRLAQWAIQETMNN